MIVRKSIAALLIAAFAIPNIAVAAERRRDAVVGDQSGVVIDLTEKERLKRKERRDTVREDKEYAPKGRDRDIVRPDKEYAPGDRGREDVRVRDNVPSAVEIQRKLEAPAAKRLNRSERVTIREFTRRPELRRAAPSIDIQAINFAFASAEIPYSQFGKVEVIADAVLRMLDRNSDAQVLIEGHTDAVGSFASNYSLSEARAASLKRLLVREFGVPSYALETVGYGEEYLLVNTPYEDWHNRRVTLRRIDEFVR